MQGNFSFFQGKLYQLRSALFRNFTLCGMVLFADLLGQPIGYIFKDVKSSNAWPRKERQIGCPNTWFQH